MMVINPQHSAPRQSWKKIGSIRFHLSWLLLWMKGAKCSPNVRMTGVKSIASRDDASFTGPPVSPHGKENDLLPSRSPNGSVERAWTIWRTTARARWWRLWYSLQGSCVWRRWSDCTCCASVAPHHPRQIKVWDHLLCDLGTSCAETVTYVQAKYWCATHISAESGCVSRDVRASINTSIVAMILPYFDDVACQHSRRLCWHTILTSHLTIFTITD